MLAFAPPFAHTSSTDGHSATTIRPRSIPRAPSNPSTSSSGSNLIAPSNQGLPRAPSKQTSKSSFPVRPPEQLRGESNSRVTDQHASSDYPPPVSHTNQRPSRNRTPPKQVAAQGPLEKMHAQDSTKLLQLLASLLQQIASANDKLYTSSTQANGDTTASSHERAASPVHRPPIWSTLTSASHEAFSTRSSCLTFHARNIPTISLEAYLLRILKYCPTTNEVFLSLLVYFDRMSKLAFDVTGKTFAIDSYNVHRLVIAGVAVASKFFSDVFYTNSRYAKVGGLPQTELNQLELQFLLLNDFRLSIGIDEFQRYAEQLQIYAQNAEAGLEPKTFHSQSAAHAKSPCDLIATSIRPVDAPDEYPSYKSTSEQDIASHSYSDIDGRSRETERYHQPSELTGNGVEAEEEDGETDDEPTIRGHSSAGSETQSLCTLENEETYSEEEGDYYGEHHIPEPSAAMSP